MFNFLYRKDVKKYYYFAEYLYFVLGIDYEHIYLKTMSRSRSLLFTYCIFRTTIFPDASRLKNGSGSDPSSISSSFLDVRNRGKWLFWRSWRLEGIVSSAADTACNWLSSNEFLISENVFWTSLHKTKFFVMKSCRKEFFSTLSCVNSFSIKRLSSFSSVKKYFIA